LTSRVKAEIWCKKSRVVLAAEIFVCGVGLTVVCLCTLLIHFTVKVTQGKRARIKP
jgi:hypothetical protein